MELLLAEVTIILLDFVKQHVRFRDLYEIP